jgi:hypothetical protein
MVEVVYKANHNGSTAAERIQNRLKSSCGSLDSAPGPETMTLPTRTRTAIHHAGSNIQHGKKGTEK